MDTEKELFRSLEMIGSVSAKKQEEIERVAALQQFLDSEHEDATTELDSYARADIISAEIARLDELGGYCGEVVRVTGRAQAGFHDEVEEKDMTETRELSDALLTSRGFDIVYDENGRKRVGYIFDTTEEPRVVSEGAHHRDMRVYKYTAPYSAVDVRGAHSNDDRRRHLGEYVPEIIEDIDDCLLNAKDQYDAIRRLGDIAIDFEAKDIPSTVIVELVEYVSEALSIDSLPLLRVDAVNSFDITPDMSVQFDTRHHSGGSASLAARVAYLDICPYILFANGQMSAMGDAMRFRLGLDVIVASPAWQVLEGRRIGVMTSNIEGVQKASMDHFSPGL